MSTFKVQKAEERGDETLSAEDIGEMSNEDKQGYALAFRRAGMSYKQIADVLHFPSEAPVRNLLKAAIESGKAEDKGLARELEFARIDRLMQSVWPAAVSGDLKAIDTAVKLIDLRTKIMGLREPMEVSGPNGGPVPVEIQNAKEQLNTRFTAISERKRERARTKSAIGH